MDERKTPQPLTIKPLTVNLFLYYTNCINLSIRFVYPSVWRKKIRSSKENLNFNVRASGRKSKHTCFSKASAKVQQIFDMTKYFCKKNSKKCTFFVNSLIFNEIKITLFWGPFRGKGVEYVVKQKNYIFISPI